MKNTLNGVRFVVAAACLSMPTAALAQFCSRDLKAAEYCECIYAETLERIKETQGISQVSMMQKLEALAKALKKCWNGGANEAAEEMQKI